MTTEGMSVDALERFCGSQPLNAAIRIKALEYKLDRALELCEDANRQVERTLVERDEARSRLDEAVNQPTYRIRQEQAERIDELENLCREIEFFLRGHPGEASVLRAKIQALLVERQEIKS